MTAIVQLREMAAAHIGTAAATATGMYDAGKHRPSHGSASIAQDGAAPGRATRTRGLTSAATDEPPLGALLGDASPRAETACAPSGTPDMFEGILAPPAPLVQGEFHPPEAGAHPTPPPASGGAPTCPAATPIPPARADVAAILHVDSVFPDFPLDASLDEAGIGAHVHAGRFNWGLTEARPSVQIHNALASPVPHAGGGIDVGATSLGVTLTYAQPRMYISRNAPEGGRRHAIIRDHEQRHVADFRSRLEAEVPRMHDLLAGAPLPTAATPVTAADEAAARTQIQNAMGAVIQPELCRFGASLRAAQDAIDSPDADTSAALMRLLALDPEVRRENDAQGHPPPAVAYQFHAGDLFVNGVRGSDVEQGQLGDCYLAAALSVLAARRPGLITSMIRHVGGNDFAVRLFTFDGDRRAEHTVVVDNHFPTNAIGNPGYMRSTESNGAGRELWPMLIEKAYAQLHHNSYNEIGGGGHPSHAFAVLTGQQPTDLEHAADGGDRWTRLTTALAEASSVVMGTRDDLSHDLVVRHGIYQDHAYPVLAARGGGDGRMIRVRNVWNTRFTTEDLPAGIAAGHTNAPEFDLPWRVAEEVSERITVLA